MKKRDVIIIVVCMAVALLGLVGIKLFAPQGSINYADIYIDDRLYEAVPLREDTVITVDQGDGKVNTIEVKDGEIFMSHSTCADQLCVQQGAMGPDSYENRPLLNWIICLPNKVTVELRVE